MTKINLGSLVNEGGNKISGIASGLDSEKLIEAAISAKTKPIKKLEEKININNQKAEAFSKMKALVLDLKDSANKLRAVPGINGYQDNVFAQKNVTLSGSTEIPPSNYVDVSADNKTEVSVFDIEVVQIAKQKIQQSRAFASTSASAVNATNIDGAFTAGTFQINGVNIALSTGNSLVEVVARINAVQNQTNVRATIIQPSSGEYRVKLESLQTGTTNAYSITDASNVLNDLFTYDVTTHPNLNVQTAQNAELKYNNIIVSRPTNTVTDFIDGLTIVALKGMPTGEKITVKIDHDKVEAATAISGFVSKYNELLLYIESQQARGGDGAYLESAIIQRNNFVSKLKQDIASSISSYVTGSSTYSTLSDIGIDMPSFADIQSSPEKRFTLDIEASTLATSLESNFESVRKVFEFDYSSSSSKFLVTKRSNKLNQTSFSLDVNTSRASNEIAKITYGATTINATYTPIDSGDLTKGGMIKGATGTIFEGFEFFYSGTGVDTSSFQVTQGVADKLFNALDSVLDKKYNATIGNLTVRASELDLEVYSLQDQVFKTKNDITTKNMRLEQQKQILVKKYAALESSLAKANSILQMLDIQQQVASGR